MSASITRGQLLSRSAKGGAALLVAGSALGRFVETAAAAPLPTGDLAYARLLVGVELLASDFYSQAIAAANTSRDDRVVPEARLRQRAGALPVGRRDPQRRGPDARRRRRHRLQLSGRDVRRARGRSSSSPGSSRALSLGAYLGAIAGMQTDALKAGLARIAACEAQHSAYFTTLLGGKTFSALVPAGAHDRPGLERARRVHGVGKGPRCGSLASSRCSRSSSSARLLAAGGASARSGRATAGITVFAGSSMTTVLPQIDPGNTYSFGSSTTLGDADQERRARPTS